MENGSKVLKIANCQIDILNEIVNKLSNLGFISSSVGNVGS